MRIGIVCYPTFGGSGVVATELGHELAQEGHEVHFISYDLPARFDRLMGNLHYHEVVVSEYPLFDYPPYELVLASKLVDVVLHEGLDILHVHYAIPHASAAFMARQILRSKGVNIPYITTLHGTDITLLGRDRSFEPVITFAMNESDAVTAVSKSLRHDTLTHFKMERDIEVIPNFIDVQRYRGCSTDGVRSAFAPNGERILLHVSNFRPVKRVDDVVRIFNLVRQQIPCKLILVGDGPERGRIENLCRELKVCDHTHFLGKLKNVEQVYSVADLFLLPSETESFGLSALEALTGGVPVISSDTGGIPEVNIHGVTGFLRPVGDVQGMSEDAIGLLKDPAMMRTFSTNAMAQADRFSKSAIIPQYEALYRRVIENVKA